MVSTRSVKHKFTEGEKVLCYEPDPAKTKVLYNSKVLGIGEKKDETGRKAVHFLIHFQGWNSTWDRFVTEDYILKDTEENRKLQKELAEKAQLTSGGNLYRRGRKRRTLSRTGSDNEKRGGDSDSEGEAGGGVQTTFSPGLQALLDADHALINGSNKLVKLPASPNAVEILEAYMKDFTISQIRLLCHKRGHLRPTAGKNAHMTVGEIFIRANLCREVADGLRVYMDFMTELGLLYPQERLQYREVATKTVSIKSVKREDKNEMKGEVKEEAELKPSSPVRETDRKKSLRSHTETNTAAALSSSQVAVNTTVKVEVPLQKTENILHGKGESSTQGKIESNSSQSKQDGLTTQTKLDGAAVDLASFLGHDVVKGGENLVLRPMSQRERDLLKKLVNRKLVPDWFLKQQGSESNPIPPCLIYGAVHLARALVKIPEIFPHAEHSESKMNSITEYLNGFTKFLEEHPDWFAENQYCDNFYSQFTDNGVMKMDIN